MLIAAHGAALANLWCAAEGSALVEVTYGGSATMYAPLARQLGMLYCDVQAVEGQSGFSQAMTTPRTEKLRECLRAILHARRPEAREPT